MLYKSLISLNSKYRDKQNARELIANNNLHCNVSAIPLKFWPLGQLDRKIKHGEHLIFGEAFGGMFYVLAATNQRFYDLMHYAFNKNGMEFDHQKAIAMGSAFLQMMAMKEAYPGLTPEEIAGMVAASFYDLTARFYFDDEIVEICGMGGDKGFSQNGVAYKTINASTLSSLTLAALGYSTMKHGSYANTSAVGSTEAIELFGAKTDQRSVDEVKRIFTETNFFFSDAHWCKTLHDLSHYLMFETVNHVIGPMTPPISAKSKLYKVMGVNEKVHPSIIAQAYELIHKRGLQQIGNVAIVAGLDGFATEACVYDHQKAKEHVFLDEVSPYTTLISLVKDGLFVGTFIIHPKDFGIAIDSREIQIKNEQETLLTKNKEVVNCQDEENIKFLAMNAAIALFVRTYLNHDNALMNDKLNPTYLTAAYHKCYTVIKSGTVRKKLKNYVEATNKNQEID
jgi:anthranilate phosphoribosyltransferase